MEALGSCKVSEVCVGDCLKGADEHDNIHFANNIASSKNGVLSEFFENEKKITFFLGFFRCPFSLPTSAKCLTESCSSL